MALDQIEGCRCDGGIHAGEIEFKLSWPGSNYEDNVWAQTSNPYFQALQTHFGLNGCEKHSRHGNGRHQVEGYRAISCPNTANQWSGIAYNGHNAVLSTAGKDHRWFYGIGSFEDNISLLCW